MWQQDKVYREGGLEERQTGSEIVSYPSLGLSSPEEEGGKSEWRTGSKTDGERWTDFYS